MPSVPRHRSFALRRTARLGSLRISIRASAETSSKEPPKSATAHAARRQRSMMLQNGKYAHGPYDCADKPGALICLIPPHCLAEIGSDESANNSKDRRQNETRRFIGARVKPFGDNAC